MLVEAGGIKLAAGGEWSLPASKGDAAEFLKRHRKSKIIDSSIVGERVLGAFPADEQGVYAGALLIGKAVPNAVIYHAIDDTQMWVAAVRDGIPLADYDKVCIRQDASRVVTDILSFNPSATVIGNLPSASQSIEEALSLLSKKDLEAFKIARPGAKLIKYGAIVGSIAFVGIVGFVLWQYQGQKVVETVAPTQSDAAILAEKQRLQRATEQYHRDVEKAVNEQFPSFLSGVSPDGAFSVLDKVLSASSLQKRGWVLSKVHCDVIAKKCVSTWAKGHMALQGDLIGIVGDKAALEMSTVSSVDSQPVEIAPVVSDFVPAGLEGVLDYVSLRDRYAPYGVNFAIDPTAVTQTATLPPPPDGVPAQTPPQLGKTVNFTLAGGIMLTREFARRLSASAKTFSITLTNIESNQPTVMVSGAVVLEGPPNGNL